MTLNYKMLFELLKGLEESVGYWI